MLRTPIAILLFALLLPACTTRVYVPERATEPYPTHLHETEMTREDGSTFRAHQSVDIQVFRDDTQIQIVNSTARSYRDVKLWMNQRWMYQLDELPAGGTVTLSLWDFFDQWGQRPNAGGFFRSYEPTPLRLVEIQLDDERPMVGLVTVNTTDPEARGQ